MRAACAAGTLICSDPGWTAQGFFDDMRMELKGPGIALVPLAPSGAFALAGLGAPAVWRRRQE